MNLFIDYTKHPALEALTRDYRATHAAITAVRQALSEVGIRKGERVNHDHQDQSLYRQREHAYEVAFIRLELANQDLLAAIQALHGSIPDVEALVKHKVFNTSSGLSYGEHPIARSNVVCALALLDEGSELSYRVKVYPPERDTTARYHFTIDHLFDNPPDSGRHYVVAFSGHGSAYRFDTPDGKTPPPPPYLTLEEAQREAAGWESIADTIGGGAQIYDIRKLTAPAAQE